MTPIITLTSGRKVKLLSFHMRQTYAGLMEGAPQRSRNEQYITESIHSIERMWGPRRHMLIPPVATADPRFATAGQSDDPVEYLPAWTYLAWLDSDPIDEYCCGSELVLVWLGDQHFDIAIADLISSALRGVDWVSAAKDFDF